MRILALETSTDLCSAALLAGDALDVEERMAPNQHAEHLGPMVSRLLARAGLSVAQLDAVAFGQGPGSFTGLRIACGMAQGLAFGADRPVIPVASLLALAEQTAAQRAVAALDARMGETYLAAYERSGDDWGPVVEPGLFPREALPVLTATGWVATGSGFDAFDWLRVAYAAQVVRHVEGELPRAATVARLAARRLAKGEFMPAELAAPLYLRDKVARTIAERKAAA